MTSQANFTFPTRRVVAEFTPTGSDPDKHTVTLAAFVQLEQNEYIQHCSMSFSGDKKEEPLGAVIHSIEFTAIDHEPLTGQMLNVRNGLLGIRGTYDMSHNRTHVTLLATEQNVTKFTLPTERGLAALFRVRLTVNQLAPKELKEMFGVKENKDLFHDPQLFVALSRGSRLIRTITDPRPLADRLFYNSRVGPVWQKQMEISFLDLDKFTSFSIPFGEFIAKASELRDTDNVLQLWFSYRIHHIQSTASMFDTLQLRYNPTDSATDNKTQILHTYSSPVQLQIVDKLIWGLFSTDPNARGAQQKYQTITTDAVPVSVMKQCELYFQVHKQFHTDFTTWVNEDQNKSAAIKNAVIVVGFGFLYERV